MFCKKLIIEMFLLFKSKTKKETRELNISDQSELMIALKNASSKSEIEQIFNKLYKLTYKKLWLNLSNKFIPPMDNESLADAFQDGWIKVLDKRKTFDSSRNAYNWIFTIIKNQIIDLIRKNSRYNVFSYDEDFDKDEDDRFIFQIEDNDPNPDELFIEIEEIALITKAVETIGDETEKMILKKRIYENMKLDEISKELNIPLASVHYKLNRALKKVKPIIENVLELSVGKR